MAFQHASLIAVIQGIFYPLTMIPLYIVAAYRGQVYPILPYISDTGAYKPESCFFSLILTTCAVLSTACIYMRYGLIKHICLTRKVEKIILKWNKIGLIAGMFIPIPEIICGSFGTKDMTIVHLLTASTGITGACLYLCIQARISYNLYPKFGDWKTNIARYVIVSINCVLYSLTCTCGMLSYMYYEGNILEFDFTKWSPEHGGYEYHVVSAFSEWLSIFSVSTFISTYMVEFRDLVISEPEFRLQSMEGGPVEKAKYNEETAVGICIYIRCGHVKLICKLHKQDPRIQKWNERSLKLGIIGAIAVNFVANFMITEVPVIHISAALTVFSCAALTLLIQLWITIVLYPIIGSGKIIIARIILTSILMVSFILHPVFAVLALVHYQGEKFNFDYSKWCPEDGGYGYHLVATITEWGIFFSVILYLSTFSTEFKDILILEPKFEMKIEEKNETKGT